MFIVIKTLHSILKLLNSETSPWQLAAGVTFGMLCGFSPFMTLQTLCLFLIVCLLRVNFSMFFLSFGFFSVLAFALDPLFDGFGYFLLVDLKEARPFWIEMTTGAIWPFFRFYNTIVVGSLAAGLILFIPVFVLSVVGVKKYRARWREQLKDSKFVKALKATPIYGLYEKFQGLREKFNLT